MRARSYRIEGNLPCGLNPQGKAWICGQGLGSVRAVVDALVKKRWPG